MKGDSCSDAEGLSRSAYLRRRIERSFERASRQEALEALAGLPEVALDVAPAAIRREARDSRWQRSAGRSLPPTGGLAGAGGVGVSLEAL